MEIELEKVNDNESNTKYTLKFSVQSKGKTYLMAAGFCDFDKKINVADKLRCIAKMIENPEDNVK